MHFRGLDLNLIVALDALLSEKNVTRAAERLFVSQPAMSAALQKLRDRLNDPLLERVGREFELTPRGRVLSGRVKDILQEIEVALYDQPQFDPGTAERTFRIAMSSYSAEILGRAVAKRLPAVAPGSSLQISDLSHESFSQVHTGILDVCVSLSERALNDARDRAYSLKSEPLYDDSFQLIAGRHNSSITPSSDYLQLCQHPYVEVRFDQDTLSVVERTLRSQPTRPKRQMIVAGFNVAMSVVSSSSRLFTFVPARLAAIYARSHDVQVLPPPLKLPALDETMYWHERGEKDPGHRWLRQFLRDAMDEVS